MNIKMLKETLTDIKHIFYYDTISSTNTFAHNESVPLNSLLIAKEQTHGKGTKGRTFVSSSQSGLYMSLKIPSILPIDKISLLSIIMGLSVYQALISLYDLRVDIKWLNDIIMNGKKLGGILVETSFDLETKDFAYVIVGLGINTTYNQNSADVLPTIYTSLDEYIQSSIDLSLLVKEIVQTFFDLIEEYKQHPQHILDTYETLLIGMNQPILINTDSTIFTQRGITEKGHLIVEDDQGNIQYLNSADVSIYPNFSKD